MNDAKAVADIRNVIAAGQMDTAELLLMNRASSSDDPLIRVQCASTLLVIGRNAASEEVLEDLYDDLWDYEGDKLPIAEGMRGLGRADLAAKILEDEKENDPVLREYALSLSMIGRHDEAIEAIRKVNEPVLDDRITLIDSLSATGNHGEAMEISDELYRNDPGDYGVLRSRSAALISAGRDKEAVKFVRGLLKADKKSPNANAATAYVMHVVGNTKAAGAYASNALKADQTHIGAMEVLAMSLMESGKFKEAGIVAGALNESDPGNLTAVKILKERGGMND
ncbi:MAG TPA: hypothetical protein VJX93_02815 [Candidatus Methanomethylophilaceae archaeon]|nr:hypothetical protein [Candidatus Methanomethylophilaceae archaeon]